MFLVIVHHGQNQQHLLHILHYFTIIFKIITLARPMHKLKSLVNSKKKKKQYFPDSLYQIDIPPLSSRTSESMKTRNTHTHKKESHISPVNCPEIFRPGGVRNNQNARPGTKGALNDRTFRDHTRIIQETESEDRKRWHEWHARRVRGNPMGPVS